MANTLKIAATTTSGETPDDHGLQLGELAINTANKKVWVGTNGNTSGNVLLYDQATAYTNTTYSEGDHGLTQANFTDTLRNKLNGIAASANNYSLPAGSSSTRGGFKIGYTESGKNYPVEVSSEKMYVNVPWSNTTYSEGDHGLTQANFTDTLRTKLNGIETGATADQDLSAYVTNTELSNELDALVDAAPGALDTLNELAASIGDDANYATTVTNLLAGKLGSTAKAADSNLLDGVDSAVYLKSPSNVSGWQNSNANFSVRSGGNSAGLHMEESDGTFGFQLYGSGTQYGFLDGEWGGWDIQKTPNGDFKVDEGSGLSRVWNANNVVGGTGISVSGQTITCTVTDTNTTYSVGDGGLTQKNFTTTLKNKLDGIATGATNTPDWTASGAGTIHAHNYTNTTYSEGDHGLTQANFTDTLRTKLNGIATSANNYSLPAAGDGTRGGVKLGYTESGKFYPVEAHGTSEKLYVNVPWVNTTYVVQDGGLTQNNFTNADHTKLNGIATSANNYSLPAGSSSTRGGFKIGYSESGQNYPVEVSSEKMYVNVPWANTTYSEGDHGLTQANFTDTLRDKLNGIAAGANNYSFPYTVSASAGNNTVVQRHSSGYIFANYYNGTGTFSTGDAGAAMGMFTGTNGTDNYGRSYNASRARTLLNVADGANNYSHPTGAGNKHIPSGGSAGQFLKYSSSGTAVWATDNNTTYSEGDHGLTQANFTDSLRSKLNGISYGANLYSLPAGSSSTRGGFKIGYTESGQNYPVEVSSEKMYVNVPWTNTTYSEGDHGLTQANFTDSLRSKLSGISYNANYYTLPLSSSSTRGGVKIGYAENGKNYPVELSSEKMYVNVPWTDNNTTYSEGDHGLTQANFTDTLRTKLNGIASSANNYSHPTGNGNNHIPSGGSADQYLKYSSAGTAVWAAVSGGGTTSWNGMENISALSSLP